MLEFETEPENDFLLVRDGLSPTDPQLARLTGSLDSIPKFLMSTSNKLYLYLRTNYGDSRKGFQIRYRSGRSDDDSAVFLRLLKVHIFC